uniref:Uncharacterized protein n=1 Tax=Cacopsylla melanoneura TaxID=428564 RepID=A0A8D9F1T2_9HEMI
MNMTLSRWLNMGFHQNHPSSDSLPNISSTPHSEASSDVVHILSHDSNSLPFFVSIHSSILVSPISFVFVLPFPVLSSSSCLPFLSVSFLFLLVVLFSLPIVFVSSPDVL